MLPLDNDHIPLGHGNISKNDKITIFDSFSIDLHLFLTNNTKILFQNILI